MGSLNSAGSLGLKASWVFVVALPIDPGPVKCWQICCFSILPGEAERKVGMFLQGVWALHMVDMVVALNHGLLFPVALEAGDSKVDLEAF